LGHIIIFSFSQQQDTEPRFFNLQFTCRKAGITRVNVLVRTTLGLVNFWFRKKCNEAGVFLQGSGDPGLTVALGDEAPSDVSSIAEVDILCPHNENRREGKEIF
jgi:hypothetical protein